MARKPKATENDSIFNRFDTDGDGIITNEEMIKARDIADFKYKQSVRDNEDKKEDQIRAMAWFALWGMLLYPVLILVTSLFGIDDAARIIGDIAPTYFVAIAGLVAAFFGATAYISKNNRNTRSRNRHNDDDDEEDC